MDKGTVILGGVLALLEERGRVGLTRHAVCEAAMGEGATLSDYFGGRDCLERIGVWRATTDFIRLK